MVKSPVSLSMFSLSMIILYAMKDMQICLALGILTGLVAVMIELQYILKKDSDAS